MHNQLKGKQNKVFIDQLVNQFGMYIISYMRLTSSPVESLIIDM